VEAELAEFRRRVEATEDRMVVWFGRRAAGELAFFTAWTDRLGDRPYEIVDVTGRQFPIVTDDGSGRLSPPAQAVGLVQLARLRSLLGTGRPTTPEEREETARHWQRLRGENAPFRIVTDRGLESAPVDIFDRLILEQATAEWQVEARLIGNTMGHNMEPYIHTGDLMLKTRVVALVDAGKAAGRWRSLGHARLPRPATR
jgi:hypothetical protein